MRPTPIFCSAQEVPERSRGQRLDARIFAHVGVLLFNRTTNFAHMCYDMISADIRKVVDKRENDMLVNVERVNARVGTDVAAARRTTTS